MKDYRRLCQNIMTTTIPMQRMTGNLSLSSLLSLSLSLSLPFSLLPKNHPIHTYFLHQEEEHKRRRRANLRNSTCPKRREKIWIPHKWQSRFFAHVTFGVADSVSRRMGARWGSPITPTSFFSTEDWRLFPFLSVIFHPANSLFTFLPPSSSPFAFVSSLWVFLWSVRSFCFCADP